MKKPILILTTLSLAGMTLQPALAGDREWATAGKVLTGVAAATVLARALAPEPCVTTTYVTAPTTVYAPPPVYVQPTVVYAQPPPATVYVQAQPVYVAAPAPCYGPPPVVVYRAPYPHPYYRHGYYAPVWHGGRRH